MCVICETNSNRSKGKSSSLCFQCMHEKTAIFDKIVKFCMICQTDTLGFFIQKYFWTHACHASKIASKVCKMECINVRSVYSNVFFSYKPSAIMVKLSMFVTFFQCFKVKTLLTLFTDSTLFLITETPQSCEKLFSATSVFILFS